jgi:adenylate cyclase
MKNRLTRGLIIGTGALCLAIFLHLAHVFDVWEWKTWDLRQQFLSNPARANDDIVIFLIDQKSLDVYEKEMGLSWPWPREMYAYIIQYCMLGKVRAVFLDFIYSESSVYGLEDDLTLASAIAESGRVFLPISLSKTPKEIDEVSLPFLEKFSLPQENIPSGAVYPRNSALLPVDSLLRSVQGVGNSTFTQDKDGIFRRLPLFYSLDSEVLPSVPLALARYIDKTLPPSSVPLDPSGQMIIRYYGPTGTYRSYSAAAIINSFAQLQEGKPPQIPPETFKGKIILVGSSAPGILDLRSTPFSPVCPGVEVLAAALDNLLQKDFIRIPPLFMTVLVLAVFSFLTAVGTSLIKKIWAAALFLVVCLGLTSGSSFLGFISGYWLVLAAPLFAVVMSFTAATLFNYSFEGRQRRFIKSAFRYYLNPHVIERVLANPAMLRLGGEKRIISSFFSDVAGFTSISEHLSPEELVRILNLYLSEMTDIILSHGGTLDKYEGDAIIAFWNAPLDQPDHALRACRAALRCQERLEELRPELKNQFGHELFMRIGVNSGYAVVGNMGSQSRFDYTAMGDTVNLASRLEGACKHYGVPILVGENTYSMSKQAVMAREVDLIRVVGKRKPERVYQIIGEKADLASEEEEKIRTFQRALLLYRKKQWDEAKKLFETMENDKLSQMYVARAKRLKRFPPPDDWSGVYDMKEK